MKNKEKTPRIRKNYSRFLEEIADEFRFSDKVLHNDEEIDDRHIIDDLSILNDNDDDLKSKKP